MCYSFANQIACDQRGDCQYFIIVLSLFHRFSFSFFLSIYSQSGPLDCRENWTRTTEYIVGKNNKKKITATIHFPFIGLTSEFLSLSVFIFINDFLLHHGIKKIL